MTNEEHRQLRELLGWYAVGRADPGERAAIEAHVAGCAECRTELGGLTAVAERLALADAARLDNRPMPPSALGDQIVRRVAASRAEQARAQAAPRPRLRTRALAAAVAVALLTGGLGAGWLLKPDPAGPPTEAVAVRIEEPQVSATALLINHTWGVEIRMSAQGFDAGHTYRVWIISDDGVRSSAGEFVGTGSAPMVCNLNSGLLRADAAGFEVVGDDGAVALTSRF